MKALTQAEAKLAYVTIYMRTVDEAVEHLHSLIANRRCGFDEGPEEWEAIATDLLERGALQRLNFFGAHFSATEWQLILEGMREKIRPTRMPPS